MLSPWGALGKMKQAELKDKRLDSRLMEVLSALGERPMFSIPAACGGYAEMAAAKWPSSRHKFDAFALGALYDSTVMTKGGGRTIHSWALRGCVCLSVAI